jgi:transposase
VDLECWDARLVAKGYRPVDRDQEFLLPPNMVDWLPEDHLAWFVIDTVAEMDTAVFHERAARCRDGQARRNAAGRAAYDPVMLLTLLIYAYACGERSSRRIERLCGTDVAFRVICAQDAPDHTVISRFRRMHLEAFTDVFARVLRLCRAAGLARLGTVAIDGSKIAANASMQANRGAEWLRDQVAKTDTGDAQNAGDADAGQEAVDRDLIQQILAEAERVDVAEDAAYGAAVRGDELPPSWHGRAGRRERIRAALAKVEAAEAARRAEQAQREAEWAARDAAALAEAEQALATELARREAARDAWEAQWEHAMAHPGTPLPRGRAPVGPEQSVQVARARARVEKARLRVAHPDTAPRPGGRRRRASTDQTNDQAGSEQAGQAQRSRRGRRGRRDPEQPPAANLTDPDSAIMPVKNGGWGQCYNGQLAVSQDHFIVVVDVTANPADITSYERMMGQTAQVGADLDAADELGTLLFDTGYCSDDTLTAPGPDRLIATGTTRSVRQAARDNPASGPPPEGASPREAMDHRLRTPEGAALYTRRGATVEPTIGNLKKIIDRFSLRGLAAVTAEAHLAAAAFNLGRLHRATTATA